MVANRTKEKIVYIGTFAADVTLCDPGQDFIVEKIVVLSAADGDIFQVEEFEGGNVVLHMVNTGNADTVEIDFPGGFNLASAKKGLKIDITDCTGMAGTDGTDAVWFYMK